MILAIENVLQLLSHNLQISGVAESDVDEDMGGCECDEDSFKLAVQCLSPCVRMQTSITTCRAYCMQIWHSCRLAITALILLFAFTCFRLLARISF